MSDLNKWLTWTPGKDSVIDGSSEIEPTKPTEPAFDGFDGSFSRESPITERNETDLTTSPEADSVSVSTKPTKPSKLRNEVNEDNQKSLSQPTEPGVRRGYLTLADMPGLQKQLELSGWNVDRRGDQLICWTRGRRKPRIQ